MISSEIYLRCFGLRVCIKAIGTVRIGILIFSRIELVCSQPETSAKIELSTPVRFGRPGRDAIECDVLRNCVNRHRGYRTSVLICNGTVDLSLWVTLFLRVCKHTRNNQGQSEEMFHMAP